MYYVYSRNNHYNLGKYLSCQIWETTQVETWETIQVENLTKYKKILKKNGFTIVSIKRLKDLDKDKDTGIVLIRKKNSLTYHWACFPNDTNIESFFGKDTLIEEIYLIKK